MASCSGMLTEVAAAAAAAAVATAPTSRSEYLNPVMRSALRR